MGSLFIFCYFAEKRAYAIIVRMKKVIKYELPNFYTKRALPPLEIDRPSLDFVSTKWRSSEDETQDSVFGALSQRDDIEQNIEDPGRLLVRPGETIVLDHLTDFGESVQGVLMHEGYGNLEAVHVATLLNILNSSEERGTGRVLDLGCGGLSRHKRNLESDGNLSDVIYADSQEHSIGRLKEEMGKDDGIIRGFRVLDKSKVGEEFEEESFGTILRLGVFDTNSEEVQGLYTVLSQGGCLVVSNSIERQPLTDFLTFIEEYFDDFDLYLGKERYLLVAKK